MPAALIDAPAGNPPNPTALTLGAAETDEVRDGYGRCSSCSCPSYSGSGYTCSRGGCGHHYNVHW